MKELQISKDLSNIIKGLSCLLIVAHHFCLRLDGRDSDNLLVHFIGARGGVIGLAVFFFLSGWGLSESQKKNKYPFIVFVSRRLSKIFIPLFITNIIYYFVLLLNNQISFNLSNLLLTAFNLKLYDGALWFCNTILIFYLIFYFSFLPNSKWIKVFICLMATILYSIVLTIVFPQASFYVYSLVGFPLGMILSLYKKSVLSIRFSGFCLLSFSLFLLGGAFIFPFYEKLFLMNYFSFLIVFILVSIIVVSHRVSLPVKLTVLPFIGFYSYEIYLLHNKVLVYVATIGHLMWYPLAFLLIVIPLAMLLKSVLKKC